MFQGVDPGFCGPSYQAPMILQDAQDTVNFYLEESPQPTSKKPIALLGAPGLNPVLSPSWVRRAGPGCSLGVNKPYTSWPMQCFWSRSW